MRYAGVNRGAGIDAVPKADVIQKTAPERQAALIRHIIEKVVIEDGQDRDIEPRMEARPFYAAMRSGMALAPPEGIEPPTQALGRPRSIR